MAVDRRAMVTMLLAALLPGCAEAKPGVVPNDTNGFRRRFLDPAGRIIDTGNNGISHSEGQGYGMIIAEADGDRMALDRIWGWTRRTLMRPDNLFSWRYDSKAASPVNDPNNASDGDILIAWALLRAAKRWPDGGYAADSKAIRDAIAAKLIVDHGGRLVLLPALAGFSTGEGVTLNPSYYVWPALDAFARADGGRWPQLVRDGERLIGQARFGKPGLPTDWVDLAGDGRIAPAAGRPPRFGFDAIRVPLYLAWSGRAVAARPFAAVWQDYVVRKVAVPAWIDVATGEAAPYPLSAGGRSVVRLILPSAPIVPPAERAQGDYYSSVLATLADVAGRRK